MGRALLVAVLALTGLLCATGIGVAAYVVSRDSVAVPVTRLQLKPSRTLTPTTARKTKSTRTTTPRTAATTTRPTTTVDDHGGGDNSGHGGGGHGGDD